MSDPSEWQDGNPHPASSHRNPSQIAQDERGPTGPKPSTTAPVRSTRPSERIDGESVENTERRAAVEDAARKSAKHADEQVGGGPTND